MEYEQFNSGTNRESSPKQEEWMLEITQEATKQLKEFFKGREPSPIRIYLEEGG